jgi:HEAT repeats/PBS lyase HEAT-like repeat
MREGASSIADLVRQALVAHTEAQEEGDFEPFHLLAERLRPFGPAALPEALRHGASPDPSVRRAAAGLLGELHDGGDGRRDELFAALARLLQREYAGEQDPEVLAALISAFGTLGDPRALPPLVRLASYPHPVVRGQVAAALPGLTGEAEDEAAVDALIALTADEDPQVRDWACFGLGTQMASDTPAVRDALAARIDDPHDDTRAEAFMGLARRRDPRVLGPLLAALARDTIFTLEIDAAGEYADPRFHPLLVNISKWWQDERADRQRLERALRRCDPTERPRYHRLERDLLAAVIERCRSNPVDGVLIGTIGLRGEFPATELTVPWGHPSGVGGALKHRVWAGEHDLEFWGVRDVARRVGKALHASIRQQLGPGVVAAGRAPLAYPE